MTLFALVLALAPQGFDAAPPDDERLGWVHDGVPASVRLAPDADASRRLARDLGLLAPSRVSGRRVPEAEVRAAVARVLDVWLGGDGDARSTLTSVRLRGLLGPDEVERLAAALRDGDGERLAGHVASLLRSAPYSARRDVAEALALDPRVEPSLRGALAQELILVEGRPALRRLAPLLAPDAPEPILRQVFTAWRGVLDAADVALLEPLVHEGAPRMAAYALQLWAGVERDPARRQEVLRLAMEWPDPALAAVALDALARGGPDPGLADELRRWVHLGDADQRALAMRSLAQFGGPEALLEEYRAARADGVGLAARAAWMPTLALSPLAEAQEEAARWLADGGWSLGVEALPVVRALARSPAVDPILPALFENPDLPERVLLPLALGRAADSSAARDHLRRLLRRPAGLEATQAVIRLGALGDPRDQALLAEVAESPEAAPAVRAEAVRALLRAGAGDGLVERMLAEPPRPYGVAEALVGALVEFGRGERRELGLRAAASGLERSDPRERLGLRIAAWQALARSGDPEEAPRLGAAFARLLEDAAGRPADEDWRDLVSIGGEHPEAAAVVGALRELARLHPELDASIGLRGWSPDEVAPEVLYWAAGAWARLDPDLAVAWLDRLDGLELTEANQFRVRALRAARARSAADRVRSLRALLEDLVALRARTFALRAAFAPEGAGWNLPHDRLADRLVLAEAELAADEEVADVLASLLEGWAEPETLTAALDLARERGAVELAVRLADRAVDLHPLDPEVRAAAARVAEAAGDLERARRSWTVVLRLLPPGFPLRDEAEAWLGAHPAAGGR